MNLLTIYILLLVILLFENPFLKSQPHPKNTSVSSTFLNSILQDYAYKTFFHHRPKTGVIYDGNVTAEYPGITISAIRLRTGSLRRKGYYGYKGFDIPAGVYVNPYVERVVLVYHNLGNWSEVYYPLPGYLLLSPVVALLAYNASCLTSKMLPELDIRAMEEPILVKFESLKVLKDGLLAKCVFFDLFGGVEFGRVVNGSVCLGLKQGHFGVVVEDNVPVPAPVKSPEIPIAVGGGGGGRGGRNGWWVGGVVGGVFLVGAAAVVVGVVAAVRRCVRQRRVEKMECVAEGGVSLAMAAVGNGKMPVAMETRTKPVLENDYVR